MNFKPLKVFEIDENTFMKLDIDKVQVLTIKGSFEEEEIENFTIPIYFEDRKEMKDLYEDYIYSLPIESKIDENFELDVFQMEIKYSLLIHEQYNVRECEAGVIEGYIDVIYINGEVYSELLITRCDYGTEAPEWLEEEKSITELTKLIINEHPDRLRLLSDPYYIRIKKHFDSL